MPDPTPLRGATLALGKKQSTSKPFGWTPLRGAIVALSKDKVIARDGRIPWHHPADLQHFKRRTMGHIIIMGRKTWESLGCKPLPGRHNIVLSRQKLTDIEHYNSIEAVFEKYSDQDIWIIGGAEIYSSAWHHLNLLDLTWVPDKPNPRGSTLLRKFRMPRKRPRLEEFMDRIPVPNDSERWQLIDYKQLEPGLENACFQQALLIDRMAPQLVGGRTTLDYALRGEGEACGFSRETVNKLIKKVVPPNLLTAYCFLDKLTGYMRYEFGFPYTIKGKLLLGSNMWPQVNHLFYVLTAAQKRLDNKKRIKYLARLNIPEQHMAALAEFIPILRIQSNVSIESEFKTGAGNRDVDWRIRSPGKRPVLIDVKKRFRDLLEMLKPMAEGKLYPDGQMPAPEHDAKILFRGIEEKLCSADPDQQLQGAWIVTDIQQEVNEIREAFNTLNPKKVHFAIFGGWNPGVTILCRRDQDIQFLLDLFQEKLSDRQMFLRQDSVFSPEDNN